MRFTSREKPWPTPLPAGPGQESVWSYPRPPRVEASSEHVVVRLGGMVIAETDRSFRVLETSHPPGYYLPRSAFREGTLSPAPGRSLCEFKGQAGYLDVTGGVVDAAHGPVTARAAAWFYRDPWPGYEMLADHVSLYPRAMDSCEVDGERVTPQPGNFYGGWITTRIVGPFKGEPGTLGW